MGRDEKRPNPGAPAGKSRRPAGKKFGRPGGKPMTGARSFGKPGQKPARRGPSPARTSAPVPAPAPAEAAQPLGLPVKPAPGLPAARPAARPARRPGGVKPLRMSGAKALGRPGAKALGLPAGRRPVKATAAPRPALAAPKPDPLVAAKQAWQPSLRWCQKELGNTAYTDQDVIAAVKRFQGQVHAVLDAPDAAAFEAAQRLAAEAVRTHAFLRWAPVPAKLPQV